MENYTYNLNYHLCLRCGKKFKHRGLLNRHLNNKNPCTINYIKVSRQELVDDYYGNYFKNINAVKSKILKSIVKKVEPINDDSYQCEYCGKTTKTSRGLSQHTQKYCLKNKKIEYRYDNVVKSSKKLLNDYMEFVKAYKSIKSGTNSINHSSVTDLIDNYNVFDNLAHIIVDCVPTEDLDKTPKNKPVKIKLKKM
jgi:DNA-directed RNA polymerase subunit RPC12/RpoP